MTEAYSEWECASGETCYGACLATGQLKHDVLTATTDALEPLLSKR